VRGATGPEEEVEEEVADAGSDVESAHGGGEGVVPVEVLDHFGAEAVVTEEDVTASEDENGLGEEFLDHRAPSMETF
jgi:hypothetical protein